MHYTCMQIILNKIGYSEMVLTKKIMQTLVKLFLKNKNNFLAKNHFEIQVRTILICTLYSIKYSIVSYFISHQQQIKRLYNIDCQMTVL
jgi:hypothetical protein